MKTYKELLTENEELTAQVEAIAKDRDDWKNAMARAASVLLLHKVPIKNINVDKALAEIKAEAVESLLPKCIYSEDHKVEIITKDMVKYNAEKIRKGEL